MRAAVRANQAPERAQTQGPALMFGDPKSMLHAQLQTHATEQLNPKS